MRVYNIQSTYDISHGIPFSLREGPVAWAGAPRPGACNHAHGACGHRNANGGAPHVDMCASAVVGRDDCQVMGYGFDGTTTTLLLDGTCTCLKRPPEWAGCAFFLLHGVVAACAPVCAGVNAAVMCCAACVACVGVEPNDALRSRIGTLRVRVTAHVTPELPKEAKPSA